MQFGDYELKVYISHTVISVLTVINYLKLRLGTLILYPLFDIFFYFSWNVLKHRAEALMKKYVIVQILSIIQLTYYLPLLSVTVGFNPVFLF